MPSYRKLVQRFEPSTSLEREVQMVLIGNGQTDALALQGEADELEDAQLSVEELRERQAELGKVKALLFYEQVRSSSSLSLYIYVCVCMFVCVVCFTCLETYV